MEPRPYLSSSDRAGCLALFDGDQPAEREAFARFLDDCGPSTFTVLEHDGGLVGCGGWTIGTDGAAELVWGTIRRDMRRLGLGRFLLLYRLAQDHAIRERRAVRSRQDVPGGGCVL